MRESGTRAGSCARAHARERIRTRTIHVFRAHAPTYVARMRYACARRERIAHNAPVKARVGTARRARTFTCTLEILGSKMFFLGLTRAYRVNFG